MFIATQASTNELRQEFHVYSNPGVDKRTPSGVPCAASLHFTPDGVSGPLHVIYYKHSPPDGGLRPHRVRGGLLMVLPTRSEASPAP